jgi:hypothetical protein
MLVIAAQAGDARSSLIVMPNAGRQALGLSVPLSMQQLPDEVIE